MMQQRVVIVGGGTAGWMAAAALAKSFGGKLDVELIESERIGTVGVGEATIPAIKNFHHLLELDEAEFISAVNGTFKLGIEFENWGRLGDRYFHPFGPPGADAWAAQFHHYWLRACKLGEQRGLGEFSVEASMARAGRFGMEGDRKPNYAYHFDAGRYAALLRAFSEERGVRRTEGLVTGVTRNADSGHIEAVHLEGERVVAGDFFIDCTGFRGLLIEQELGAGWEDWSGWLKSDSAIAVQTTAVRPPTPYTRCTARSAGWQWKIPLQHRVGNGLVFCSDFINPEAAEQQLLDNLEGDPLTDPKLIRFQTGRRKRQWVGNCLALGLSSGFLEPLESTSIHLIQNSIIRFIKLFPAGEVNPVEIEQFNREARVEMEQIRDFIILHYHVNQRTDSPYWVECREMDIPESLRHKIDLFGASGRVFREYGELFAEQSWVAVMLGQGVEPTGYHPFVDQITDEELKSFLVRIRASIAEIVGRQPEHGAYVKALGDVAAATVG
jgi:tryptophan halogenase